MAGRHDTMTARPSGGPMGHGPMGGGVSERPESFTGFVRDLVRYAHAWLPVMAAALVLGGVGAALQIVGPDKLSDMTDEIQKGIVPVRHGDALPTLRDVDMGAVASIGWTLVFLYGAGALLTWLQSFLLAGTTQRIAQRMRTDVSRKIDRLPLKWFDGTTTGDVLSRLTNDVDAVGQSLSQSLGIIVTSVTMLIGSIVMMFHTNWLMAVTAIGSSVIGVIVMALVMKTSQRFFARQQIGLGETNGHVEEVYSSQLAVKSYGAEEKLGARFDKLNADLYDSAWRSQFFSGLMMPLMNFIGNLGYVAVCVVGAWMVMDDRISFGVIVAFMMYVRLFTQPLSQLAQAFQAMQRAAAGGERVFGLLAAEEMPDESGKPTIPAAVEAAGRTADNGGADGASSPSPATDDGGTHDGHRTADGPVRGMVDIEHLRFGYDPDKPVIHDLNLHVEPGWKVAIVGPTGAGKSTIISLLMRFYDQQGGRILIDGVDTREVDRASVHALFGMVLQDPWTFRGTVTDNVRYTTDATDEQVREACRAVGADRFISNLPDGYDTVLEGEGTLSQGQRQLLTIARAMVKDAPMMILDEATSNVDTRTERLIQSSMDKVSSGRTSFVIAHRLSTIRNADLILVLKDGDVIEQGTHDQLLAMHGFYAGLYESQFANCD